MTSMPPVNGALAPKNNQSTNYGSMITKNRKVVKSITNLNTKRNPSPMEISGYGADGLMRTQITTGSSVIFNFNMPVFTVKADSLDRSPKRISTDSLHRLVIRAKHKVDRLKYDSTNEACKG